MYFSRKNRCQKPRCRQTMQQRNSGYGRKLAVEGLEERQMLSASAQLLVDINPGAGASRSTHFTEVSASTFFFSDDGSSGRELWKTDGTAAGTVMVKDINPGSGNGIPYTSPGPDLTNVNSTLYFTADSGNTGWELWKSDGTAAGTVLVKDIIPGSSGSHPRNLTNVNGTLFFSARDEPSGTLELWKSDGTAAGTMLVKDILVHSGTTDGELIDFNGTLFFTARETPSDYELWKSDGTTAGTVLVKDINTGSFDGGGSSPLGLTVVNDTLYFSANDGSHGRELWKSDGTAAGTVMVKDINPSRFGGPSRLTIVNGTLYFTANDGSGQELWKSNGTAAGTVLVKDINPGSGGSNSTMLIDLNGTLVFSADDGTTGRELWKSDGTAAGTVLLKDIEPGSGDSSPLGAAVVNDRLFFSADSWYGGRELWTSDGTSVARVADLYPGGAASNPFRFMEIDGALVFTADDGTYGRELWTLDTTDFSFETVTIDVKPGSEVNPVNLSANGTIAVTMFTTDDFDATTVNVESVYFGNAYASQTAFEDVDGDGDLDMILHFNLQDTGLESLYIQLLREDMDADGVLDATNQEAEVSLGGQTNDDVLFDGLDTLDLSLRGRALRELLDELFAEPDLGNGGA